MDYYLTRMKVGIYKDCFVQKRIDDDWVWIIQNRVGLWVAQKGNSGLWDCVKTYSQYLGIIKERLTRKEFAELIVNLHPQGLKEGKTKKQLKGSMDQCPISLKLNQITTYPEHDERGKIVRELDELFSTPIPESKQKPSPHTVESRLEEYLEKRVVSNQYACLCYNETYCGYSTTLSIERYASETFKNQKMPSSILVFECVESKVSDEMILIIDSRYRTDSKIKPVIAASSGFDEHVKKVARERNICLIRVNPQYEITDNDILTPRMKGGNSVHGYEHRMLSDKTPMTVPLVIQDGDYLTTSLTDFLKRNNIPVDNPGSARAPLLTRDFIENIVSQLIQKDVEGYAAMLKRCDVNDKVPYCPIDPYKYATQDNLIIVRTDLSKQQHLGHIDMKKKVVRLSNDFEKDNPRDRFSMAHEYGHHVLHSHHMFRDFLERDAELEGQACSDIWEKHWLEVQANIFASFMLMPRELVQLLYNLYWRKWFRHDEVQPMCIEEPMYWNKDYQNVVGPIARHLGVSSNAMKISLLNMGLLIDPKEMDEK